MSSALFPAGLVPFEDLFSRPPNPMLGPSFPPAGPAAHQEAFRRSSHLLSGLGPPPGASSLGGPEPQSSSEEDLACKPPSPDGPMTPPCWDFGDLFGRPPNPMLSPSGRLLGSGPCEAPASPPSRAAPGQSECQVRPEAVSPDRASCHPAGKVRPKKGSCGPRLDAKKSQERQGAAAKGKPQDEDFAELLEQYRQDRRAPSPDSPASPGPPAPPAPLAPPGRPAPKSKAKRGAGGAGLGAGRAKKKKRKGSARAPGPPRPAGPPAAQERPPVSQEFVQRNTVALGSQRVCKYFLAGRCLRGEQCRLDHRADGLKFQQLCKFYVQGYCTRGQQCRYLHHEFPCKFFHTGTKCYQGDHCGFSHAPLTPETQALLKAALASPAPPQPEPAPASS